MRTITTVRVNQLTCNVSISSSLLNALTTRFSTTLSTRLSSRTYCESREIARESERERERARKVRAELVGAYNRAETGQKKRSTKKKNHGGRRCTDREDNYTKQQPYRTAVAVQAATD